MPDTIGIREAGPDDLSIILHHRKAMFQDMGYTDEDELEAMSTSSAHWLIPALAEGRYRGWLAELPGGEIVAGGGLLIAPWLGHPRDPRPMKGEICNVYTEPSYRRRGLARRLMEVMIAWCRVQGFASVVLHASVDGRALYESMGFKPTNEMTLSLK